MKKLNNNGFVLAETLIVTVFVLTLFSMIYRNFYPIIGLYEQRETYDDVDGKYVAYWVKKIIENNNFVFETDATKKANAQWFMNTYGYLRLNCDDISTTANDDTGASMCRTLLKALEVSGCDNDSNNCDVFITHYRIGSAPADNISPDFKDTVNTANLKRYQEGFIGTTGGAYSRSCVNNNEIACKKHLHFMFVERKKELYCSPSLFSSTAGSITGISIVGISFAGIVSTAGSAVSLPLYGS